jgi:hypothetical protein
MMRRAGKGVHMRHALRLGLLCLGLSLVAAALWPAWREAAALAAGSHAFIPLGQLWFELDPPSLNMAQAGIQRHVAPWLWEDVVQPLLELPAWPVLGLAGLGLAGLAILGISRSRRRAEATAWQAA